MRSTLESKKKESQCLLHSFPFHPSLQGSQSEQGSWGGKEEKVWAEKGASTITHSSNMWQQIIMGTTAIDQQSAGNWYQQSIFSSFLSTHSSHTHSGHHSVENIPRHHVAHSTRWLLQSIKGKLNYSNKYANEILFVCIWVVAPFFASYIPQWWRKHHLYLQVCSWNILQSNVLCPEGGREDYIYSTEMLLSHRWV